MEILSSFESPEKLLLISFNEAMNIYLLTGTKEFLHSMIDLMLRIFADPTKRSFTLNFLANFVIKPSAVVIKKAGSDNKFLQKDVFNSEVDASMYPLPSMIYYLTKNLLLKN